jgi:hypothetical protein
MGIPTMARATTEIMFSAPMQGIAVSATGSALYGWLLAKVKGKPIEKELEAVMAGPTKESVCALETKLAEVLTENEELRREMEGRQEIRVWVDNSTKISQSQNIHGANAKVNQIGNVQGPLIINT